MRTYPYPPDIEAEITFVPAEQGGRKTPALSGYRPQFYFGGFDYDADQEYPDVGSVAPGQSTRALLRFFSPDYIVGKIFTDMEFQVREGLRVVAHGRVTKILHLEESAKRVRNKRQYIMVTHVRLSAVKILRTGTDGGHLYIKGRGEVPGEGEWDIFAYFRSKECERKFEQEFTGQPVVVDTDSLQFTRGIGGAVREIISWKFE